MEERDDADDGYNEKSYMLEYSEFHGSPTDDVHLFLQDFEAIAQYNEQSNDKEKLRILPGLLKKRALVWFKSLPAEEIDDWTRLRGAMIKEFRRNPHKLLSKLSRIKKKPEETIGRYSIRLLKLINKLQLVDEPYPERVKVWWYLKGLPTSVRKYCLQGDHATLDATISTAKIFESTAMTTPRGEHPQGQSDADLCSEHSDVESCTSIGTFVSSVPESVDSKAKKIAPRKVFSAAGIKQKVSSPWDRQIGKCNDRPLTGASRSEQKPGRKMNINGTKPPESPLRRTLDIERLQTMNLNERLPVQRRK